MKDFFSSLSLGRNNLFRHYAKTECNPGEEQNGKRTQRQHEAWEHAKHGLKWLLVWASLDMPLRRKLTIMQLWACPLGIFVRIKKNIGCKNLHGGIYWSQLTCHSGIPGTSSMSNMMKIVSRKCASIHDVERWTTAILFINGQMCALHQHEISFPPLSAKSWVADSGSLDQQSNSIALRFVCHSLWHPWFQLSSHVKVCLYKKHHD